MRQQDGAPRTLLPEQLEQRWAKIRAKIAKNADILRHQGFLVRKADRKYHYVCIRFIDRSAGRAISRSIFVAQETDRELVEQAKRALLELRQSAKWCREVQQFEKVANALRFLCAKRVVRRRSGIG